MENAPGRQICAEFHRGSGRYKPVRSVLKVLLDARPIHGMRKALLVLQGLWEKQLVVYFLKSTSAGMPGLSFRLGLATARVTAYTDEPRPSTVCTLRGVN